MMKRLAVLFVISLLVIFSAQSAFAKGQNIIKMSSNIEIAKDMVASDVVAIGGNIKVAGKVESNVVAVGGSVILKEGSSVGGEIVVVGGEVMKSPTAEIGGKITQIYVPNFVPSFATFLKGGWLALWATISILALLGFLGLTILFVAIIPEHVGTVVNALGHSFAAMLLWGILWSILIVPVAVLLAVSIIGIILIPLEVLIVVLALIIGYISAAVLIGKNILLSFKKTPPPFVDAILGIIILFLVGFVPVVGMMIKAVFLVAGFGAVLTTRFGTIR